MNTETLMTVCGWIGALVVASCAVMIVYYAFDSMRNLIHVLRWTYRYKHRFDKSPTAKCYCKDCIYHGTTYKDGGSNKCDFPGIEIWTPDEGFCFEAEPINAQEAKKRGK